MCLPRGSTWELSRMAGNMTGNDSRLLGTAQRHTCLEENRAFQKRTTGGLELVERQAGLLSPKPATANQAEGRRTCTTMRLAFMASGTSAAKCQAL